MSAENHVPVEPPAAAHSSGQPGGDELERLQNLLVGDHARQTTDRIDMLEQVLLGSMGDLRAELHGRASQFEESVMSMLSTRLNDEAAERIAAFDAINERIDNVAAERSMVFQRVNRAVAKVVAGQAAALQSVNERVDHVVSEQAAALQIPNEDASPLVTKDLSQQREVEHSSSLAALIEHVDQQFARHESAIDEVRLRLAEECLARGHALDDLVADLRASENDLNSVLEATEATLSRQIAVLRSALGEPTS